jgi:hypothetical protein
MSFISSTIGVVCLAFTDFEFNRVYFFRPLMIVMVVTYFYGCWWLPALLSLLDSDKLKLGRDVPMDSESAVGGDSTPEDEISGPLNSDVDKMKAEENSSPGVEADMVAAPEDRISNTTTTDSVEGPAMMKSVAETHAA